MSRSINVELSSDEGLVLFEYLSRFSDTGKLVFEDKAEEIVLWNLTCLLEKALLEPFKPNYGQTLQEARDRLRGDNDAT